MAKSAQPKKIKPFEAWTAVIDPDLLGSSRTVEKNMDGNVNFPAPPVDVKTLKADNDTFEALMAEAADGSRKAVAAKDKQRRVVIKDLRLNGRYVEEISDGDPAKFKTSGFVALSGTRMPQAPLSPHIRAIEHGPNTGQLLVKMKAGAGALSYELRYGAQTNGTVANWTTQLVTGVRAPITISSLTPGTLYGFSARAINKTGYSDWTDPITMMST